MALKGIEKVRDREKARFFGTLVGDLGWERNAHVTRKDHLQIDIDGMPVWAHLAVVFHPREKELGVEFHLENTPEVNKRVLEFVQSRLGSNPDDQIPRLRFDSTWRDTQGWTRAYVRTPCDTPSVRIRRWAEESLQALQEAVAPVMAEARESGIL